MNNQELSFHPIIVLGSLENLNGSDLSHGGHKKSKLVFWSLNLFTNISKFMTGQQLKFDIIAILDMPIVINDSDFELWNPYSRVPK